MKLGATGEFPYGKLNDNDEGGLIAAVSEEKDVVRIDFGKHVAWLALKPEQAIVFATAIVQRAIDIMRRDAP